MQNWDKYRRMQCNIEKAVINQEVNQQMKKHYSYLHSSLVTAEEDEDIFNDTFLKLTYNYSPEQQFQQQFRYYFNLLKGAYRRDSKAKIILPIKEERISD